MDNATFTWDPDHPASISNISLKVKYDVYCRKDSRTGVNVIILKLFLPKKTVRVVTRLDLCPALLLSMLPKFIPVNKAVNEKEQLEKGCWRSSRKNNATKDRLLNCFQVHNLLVVVV
jgi:hypothetical protein